MSERELIDARVLAVDDQPDALSLLEHILKAHGFGVVLAAGGREALEIVRSTPVDVILLDVMMPDLDGMQVCERLKSSPETASIPVILVTARDDMETRARGMALGVADFLAKPLNRPELIRRLKVQVAARRHFLELEELNRRAHSIA